jgi:hypothetical protein
MRRNPYGALEGAVDVRAAAWFDAARPHNWEKFRGSKVLALTRARTRGMTPRKGNDRGPDRSQRGPSNRPL